RGSVGQVFVTHADPGQLLTLRDNTGAFIESAEADAMGSFIFRELKAAPLYFVSTAGPPAEISEGIAVLDFASSTPDPAFYDAQTLEPGFHYITMRDGTQLSVYVQLPGPPEDGPYPTLVNYSGYSPSQPGGELSLGGGAIDVTAFCGDFPVLCDAPNHPSGIIGGVMGFATVGVNMRGTGCSGGAYDFFEPLQLTDGYDAIEIIASQPWVKHGKVGMAGLSYPGITQLFVASMQPPSLAAITPLSVISGVDTILGPGGMYNDGFAIEWGQQVLDRADPYGQGWEQGLVDAGDTVCEENQLLHSQKVDIIQKAFDNPFYDPDIYDPLSPRTFVDEIQVPVFTSGQWQDEQTGGHFPDLWNRFTQAPIVRFTGLNGAHADGYTPQILIEWKTFLDFYVSQEVRDVPFLIKVFAPLLFNEIFGASVSIPPHRFLGHPDFATALAAYEAEDPGRIIFESGAGTDPGAPVGSFEITLPEWPPPATVAERWYLNADGSLRTTPPVEVESASAFQHANEKGGETYIVNDAFERALPDITWEPWQAGRQAVWLSAPLGDDLVYLGHASADLYVQSTSDDADLEVMVSEVRPDGQEVYVTSGWLRASRRELDLAESTPLKPKQTHFEEDAEVLPAGAWELVRVEVFPAAHVFRAGSQLRISVATPGANKGRWKFDVLEYLDPVTHGISHSVAFPSSVLLPVVPGIVAPPALPPCPGLRSQPCRDYEPHTNALW
ncbi:MAG: CocE/NonD family hydrolase, partial [Deltaproteobacteria bacterium]|nr:CocE/NonD family hydrolase [Deltaproteobacteria bacterium]